MMPSESQGTITKHKGTYRYNLTLIVVMELHEPRSSSSSSIGKEEYANQAYNGSGQGHKSKNQFFSQDKDI